MDFSGFTDWAGDMGHYLPSIIGAIVIFIVGWIVAAICRTVIRKALGKVGVNERLSGKAGGAINLEKLIASVVFWVIFLFALIAAFNVLNLDMVSGPLQALASAIMLYLPRILLAGALALIAWVLATLARTFTAKGLKSLDKKVADEDGDSVPLSKTLADVFFWLVILLFLPAIVGALEMGGLLEPLTSMVDQLLGFLPNLIAAAFIAGIGYLIAKVLRNVVAGLLVAANVDKLTRSKSGKGGLKLSQLGSTLVFIFVLVPALIAALQALQMEVLATPAEHMLQLFMIAIPNIFAAAIILFIAWYIGRFIAEMLTQLLNQIGFNELPQRLGLKPTEAVAEDGRKATTPAQVVGRIVLFFVMAFAVMEAASRLGFGGIDELFEQLIAFASQVVFGLIILAVGQWLASAAAKAIRQTSGQHSGALARITQIGILGLVIAMGLHAMGFADSVVNLAFGLTLGAVAVALALAFGLGGRDAAGRIANRWADGYLDDRDD